MEVEPSVHTRPRPRPLSAVLRLGLLLAASAALCAGLGFVTFPARPSCRSVGTLVGAFAGCQPQGSRRDGRSPRRFFDNLFDSPESRDVELERGGPDSPQGFDSKSLQLAILSYPHPALRRENKPVTVFDNKLQTLVQNLFTSMYATGDGIGLAAPQVGVNLRVMVYNEYPATRDEEIVFINPEITKRSNETDVREEACLSFPRMSGPVPRNLWIEVTAVDFEGRPFQRRIYGKEARCFQHEYDHLDGIMYVDRVEGAEREYLQPKLDALVEQYVSSGKLQPAI